MAHTILIVEDELKIRELLRGYFERKGFAVVTTGSGAEAITLAGSTDPDLIVLDLRLPDVSGEVVAAEVRRTSGTPILMLTAKTAEEDRIHGLELGADDYVTKPFSPREVVLRAQAILRRSGVDRAAGPLSFGDGLLTIDEARHEVRVDGTQIELTATEFGLLSALASRPGRVYARAELLNARYSPPGASISVESGRLPDGQTFVRVTDSGPGLNVDDIAHVFDRFYRGSAAQGTEGSGVGLAIAAELAGAHGGHLTAANAAIGGACFTLTLPPAAA